MTAYRKAWLPTAKGGPSCGHGRFDASFFRSFMEETAIHSGKFKPLP
jgi:hypothetical protein